MILFELYNAQSSFMSYELLYIQYIKVNKTAPVKLILAQLLSTNAFNANTFCLKVLSTSTAIYSNCIGNTNNISTEFHQREQVFRKWHWIY